MATIPVYLRERLASSLVGTPGVDTSGAHIGQSVASVFGDLADTQMQIQKQRQDSLNAVDATNLITEFDVASQNVLREHQREYATDPAKKSDVFKERMQDNLNAILEKAPNEQVKRSVQKMAAGKMGQRMVEEGDWAFKQENVVAANKLVQSNNTLANQAYLIGSSLDLVPGEKAQMVSDLLTSANGNISAASGILSADQVSKFSNDHPLSIMKGYLSGLIEKDPATAVKLLSSPDTFMVQDGESVRDLLGEERKKLLKDAQDRFKSFAEIAETNRQVDAAMANQEVFQKIVDKTATLQDLDAVYDQAQTPAEKAAAGSLREYFLKNSDFNALTDNDQYLKFMSKYDKIKNDLSKDKKLRGPLEQVISFDQELNDAVNKGWIRAVDARGIQKAFSGALLQKIKKQDSGPWMFKDGFDEGYSAINSWLSKNKMTDNTQKKGDMIRAFVRQFTAEEDQSPARAKNVVQDIISAQSTKDNPSLSHLPAMPNAIMRQDGRTTNILAGSSPLTTEANVTSSYVVQINNKTGQKRRLYKDGRTEAIE